MKRLLRFCRLLALLLACPLRGSASPSTAVVNIKECPQGCTKHGNCNGETGTCDCPFGYGGADCSTRLLPACHLAADLPTSIPQFGHFFPKNCQCWKQLQKLACRRPLNSELRGCDNYQFWSWNELICFEWKDSADDEQTSDPPRGPKDDRVRWRKGRWDESAAQRGNDPFTLVDAPGPPDPYVNLDQATPVPLEDCGPHRCSGRGWCSEPKNWGNPEQKLAPFCKCQGFYEGDTCATPANEHCYASCSGRGTCVGGFCHCQEGWWGLGCTRSKAYEGQVWQPHPSKLRVYVYDLPEHVAYRKAWHDEPALVDKMYIAEHPFMDALLGDWAVRTEDPWEANLFVIPAYTFYYTGNVGYPGRHWTSVFNYVRTTWPFWNMTAGRNHIAWATNDRGVCDIYRHQPELQHPIKIVHFAQAAKHRHGTGGNNRDSQNLAHEDDPAWVAAKREFQRLMTDKQVDSKGLVVRFKGFPGYDEAAIKAEREPCFRPEQDVSVPNYLDLGWLDHAREAYDTSGPRPRLANAGDRTTFFLFNGFTKEDMSYSGGVRQGLLAMFAKTTRPNVKINKGATGKDMLRSKFCLCPTGYGWGIRFTQAMHTGCVPVIVQDHIYPAFWDLVPYEKFSVRINRHNLHRLWDILDAITPDQLAELQQGVADYHKHFIWHLSYGGLAYNNTMSSLHRRLLNMWTALF